MIKTKIDKTKEWEISIIKFRNNIGEKYKVTRRLPEYSISETKIYCSKDKAKEQFEEWLS